MRISLIAALAANRVIGADRRMPWHLAADLRRFRRITLGKTLIMGRRTHESIGRPLPGRKNVVLSRDPRYVAPGCTVVHDLEAALAEVEGEEAMVIGGEALFRDLLPRADRLYLTLIHGDFEGDTHFPEFDREEWREVERIEVEDETECGFPYSFVTLERCP